MLFNLFPYLKRLEKINTLPMQGRIKEVIGIVIKAFNPGMEIGSLCEIYNPDTGTSISGQAVGFRGKDIFIMPFGDTQGISPRGLIIPSGGSSLIPVGDEFLGRVIDGMGDPIDNLGSVHTTQTQELYPSSINPLERRRIDSFLDTGIKAINGSLTVGKGQRTGIFAGSGVGKSVLLGMMARYTQVDVNIIAMIGERGREVKEFIERDLGSQGLKKSVVIAATSDQAPLIRLRGAFIASAMAEFFREQGKDVLLVMDSVTRFAMAQREIGLSVGEPPTTKGYPPSVFSLLPKLLERAGNSRSTGTITGFYTILVEGDDPNEPISDSVRSIIDGHILLDRKIASKNHFPAIDILNSKSRVMNDVVGKKEILLASYLNQTLATYREAEDLINIGAYVPGSNPAIDYAMEKINGINTFLRQDVKEKVPYAQCIAMLEQIFPEPPPGF